MAVLPPYVDGHGQLPDAGLLSVSRCGTDFLARGGGGGTKSRLRPLPGITRSLTEADLVAAIPRCYLLFKNSPYFCVALDLDGT
jgi:hypothetical protein